MMLGQGRGNILVRGVQKIKEWIVAVKLERNFTKEEIITLYLNRAPGVTCTASEMLRVPIFKKSLST